MTLEEKILKILTKTLQHSLTGVPSVFISDTTVRTGLKGFAVYVIDDAVLTSIDYIPSTNSTSNSLVGPTLLAGSIIYLRGLSSIELASGSLFVYELEE